MGENNRAVKMFLDSVRSTRNPRAFQDRWAQHSNAVVARWRIASCLVFVRRWLRLVAVAFVAWFIFVSMSPSDMRSALVAYVLASLMGGVAWLIEPVLHDSLRGEGVWK